MCRLTSMHYAQFEALINIATLEIYEGKLPRRALVLVLEWAAEHRDGPPNRVGPSEVTKLTGH